jgi:hypothetical protein
VLWEFDYGNGNIRALLGGIQNATGLAVTPNGEEALISQGDDAPDGTIWAVNLARKTVTKVEFGLRCPGAMQILGDGSLAVVTAGALLHVSI